MLRALILLCASGLGLLTFPNCIAATGERESASAEIIEFVKFVRTSHCPSTGLPKLPCDGYEIIPVVPHCAGGKIRSKNLKWVKSYLVKQTIKEQLKPCKIKLDQLEIVSFKDVSHAIESMHSNDFRRWIRSRSNVCQIREPEKNLKLVRPYQFELVFHIAGEKDSRKIVIVPNDDYKEESPAKDTDWDVQYLGKQTYQQRRESLRKQALEEDKPLCKGVGVNPGVPAPG
jgi:hypothetical protein